MKKLRIEELAVESFPTTDAPAEQGTVQGHQVTMACGGPTHDNAYTCDWFYTCQPTCDFIYTCQNTCNQQTCVHDPSCPGFYTCWPEC